MILTNEHNNNNQKMTGRGEGVNTIAKERTKENN